MLFEQRLLRDLVLDQLPDGHCGRDLCQTPLLLSGDD